MKDVRYVKETGLAAATLGDESVILQAERGLYFGTNALGTRIFELFETPQTPAEVAETLEPEYDVEPEQLRADVEAFVQELIQNGLLRPAAD